MFITGGSSRTRASVTVAISVVAAALIAGCSGGQTFSDKVNAGDPVDSILKPGITANVKDGQVGVLPGKPLEIKSTDGKLDSVEVKSATGAVKGTLSEDGLTWTSIGQFGYGKKYTATIAAKGLGGAKTSTLTFTTRAPENITQAYLMPANNETVGVGQPVAVRFDESITNRKAAQDAIKVTTNPPVEGAFYWISDREVRWRPEDYWKSGTKINVEVNTYGIDLGGGTFGQENQKLSFTIGRSLIATADDSTKTVVVREDGKVIQEMPTSMGKDSTPTDNGTYIIGERLNSIVMDSSTYGVPVNSPDGYRLDVAWATQMSYSGIYLHSAPWSVGSQGYTNTSHGCLNLSPDNARWFVENALRGDIVIVKNTVGPQLSGLDGLGDWNIPWSQWKKGNADND